ncbi:LemA family protein [Nostoc ellipsosporum NOK]|jgi:LemA protein|nr:LemA family protein [Nostoc ellipsosporum NOK]
MTKRNKILLVVIAVATLLVIWLVVAYNGFISKQEKVDQTWADVQATYQRRLDLIPQLVSTVKGVSGFESSTLIEITEARSRASQVTITGTPDSAGYRQHQALQDSLAGAANRLIAQVESYPELRGTEAYRKLQIQLEGSERRIRVARQDFNKAVNDYNISVRSFPGNLVAGLFGFRQKEGFQADIGADKAVEIKF